MITHTIRDVFRAYFDRFEPTVLGAQRLFIFDLVAVGSLVTTSYSIFARTTHIVTEYMAMSVMAITIMLILLYHLRYFSLRWSATALIILLQVQTATDMLTLALLGSPDSETWIMLDTLTSLLLIMTSLVALLKYTPAIISAISIITYTLCVHYFPNPTLTTVYPFYLVILVAVVFFDLVMTQTTLHLQEENEELKDELYDFFKVSGMSREQLHAYISLVKESGRTSDHTRELLNFIDSRAQQKIVSSVKTVMAENASRMELLQRAFPTLSRSQLSIVQLILQGKKLSEICFLLGKNESNVSTQRSHIRAELNLGADENLADALNNRLQSYLEKRELFQ